MPDLHGAMSNMLCCFGSDNRFVSKQRSTPREAPYDKDTPISMSVHGGNVPHMLDSPDALHRIFASNSSMRGYNAVQTILPKARVAHGSPDRILGLGSQSPKKKPSGRLEQLTNHVKQKLSESGLSRTSGRGEKKESASIPLESSRLEQDPDAASQLLSGSQKSVGMTEMLASRAASEGGYDSDAKSIQTATILTVAGASRIGPRNVRNCLATIDGSQADEQTCLAINVSENESPSAVLRRVSNGTAKSAIVAQSSSIQCVEQKSCVAMIEADCTGAIVGISDIDSGSGHNELSVDKTLGDVTQCASVTKPESAGPVGADTLLSELDPVPLDSVENQALSDLSGSREEASPPATAIKVGSRQPGEDHEATQHHAQNHEQEQGGRQRPDTHSNTSSDAESLHLFNMRISQTLASQSRIPMLTSTSALNNDSATSLMPVRSHMTTARDRQRSSGRLPTFITIEHNRLPSDPETKKIFECAASGRPPSKWKRSFSDGSFVAPDTLAKDSAPLEDSSSYYSSIVEAEAGDYETSVPLTKTASIKNVNSLAVGGRSASGSILSKRVTGPSRDFNQQRAYVSTTDGNLSNENGSDEIPSFSTNALRGRSVSMPKQSKFIKVDTTPTPVGRRYLSMTEENEDMSEIDAGRIMHDRRVLGSSTSTQAREDHGNEQLSEINPSLAGLDLTAQDGRKNSETAWLSHGRRSGWGFKFVDSTSAQQVPGYSSSKTGNGGFTHRVSLGEQADTSEVWHKAFQQLRDPSNRGKLLATPQFDREGRRRPSARSISNELQPSRTGSISPNFHRRSQSVDVGRHVFEDGPEKQKQRRKSVPILRAKRSGTVEQKSQAARAREKLKKTSLADLGRIVTSGALLPRARKKGSSDEDLGIWARFGSHNRQQRNGPAGSDDEVKVRDFGGELRNRPYLHSTSPRNKSTSSLGLRPRGSWGLFARTRPALKRQHQHTHTRNATLSAPSVDRAKIRRKGFVSRFQQLYRAKSSEIHAYATTQGHRSSVFPGLSAEYPELECLPGQGMVTPRLLHALSGSGVDGTDDEEHAVSLDTISEVTSKRSKSMHSHTLPWSRRDAEVWSKMYQDCVGSLSALRSDEDDVQNRPPTCGRRILSLSEALRDSTINFQAELEKDTDKAKERLLQQLQSSDKSQKALRMPGSFV